MPFATKPRIFPALEADGVERPKLSIPFSRSSENAVIYVLEGTPMSVGAHFKVKSRMQNGKWSHKVSAIERAKIKVPWQYFIVRMNKASAITDTFLWFSKGKIVDPEEGLVFMPPLPNIYPSGHICNGTIRVNFGDPISEKVRSAYESFWTTPFTEETWPENSGLVPACWKHDGHYIIEYGYLKYIFRYWEEHDKSRKHKQITECNSFPWSHFVVQNKAMPKWNDSYIKTLDSAMLYAMDFVTPRADR